MLSKVLPISPPSSQLNSKNSFQSASCDADFALSDPMDWLKLAKDLLKSGGVERFNSAVQSREWKNACDWIDLNAAGP